MIGVVGAGSWGTALTIHLARTGTPVRLWAREREIVDGIRARRRNPLYMPDCDVPADVDVTSDIAAVVAGADVIVMVVPSEFFAVTRTPLSPTSYSLAAAVRRFFYSSASGGDRSRRLPRRIAPVPNCPRMASSATAITRMDCTPQTEKPRRPWPPMTTS